MNALVSRLDGLLLTGGGDLDPALFNGTPIHRSMMLMQNGTMWKSTSSSRLYRLAFPSYASAAASRYSMLPWVERFIRILDHKTRCPET